MRSDKGRSRFLDLKVDSFKVRDKDSDSRQTFAEVFDENTLLTLYKLFGDKVIDIVEYPIATGKEGNVYKGKSPNGRSVAIKIYRTATATFKHLAKYILGDKRFKGIKPQSRNMIYAWAQKEYRNLEAMHSARARVPKPIRNLDNVLVMEYIGDERSPAPMLRTTRVDDPDKLFLEVVRNMKRIRKANLVHGDLSEYNILMWKNKPYIIDVGQAVPLDHPMAEEYFQRDVKNMVRYFGSLGVKALEDDLAREIRGP